MRQKRLLDLALEGALVRQEQVLGQLLRDRRAALDDAAAAGIDGQGAQSADRVDAPMLVETPVLGREGGLHEIIREFLELVGIVEVQAAPPDLLAVAIEEGDREVLRLQPVLFGLSKGRQGERQHHHRTQQAKGRRLACQVEKDPHRAAKAQVFRAVGEPFPPVGEPATGLVQDRIEPRIRSQGRALDPSDQGGRGNGAHNGPRTGLQT